MHSSYSLPDCHPSETKGEEKKEKSSAIDSVGSVHSEFVLVAHNLEYTGCAAAPRSLR